MTITVTKSTSGKFLMLTYTSPGPDEDYDSVCILIDCICEIRMERNNTTTDLFLISGNEYDLGWDQVDSVGGVTPIDSNQKLHDELMKLIDP